MCGRFVQATPVAELARMFGFPELLNLEPNWNVAPTQDVAVVGRGEDGGRHLRTMRWGLVPFWAKDVGIGSKMINARADGIAEKPAFREAFKRKRLIIPADGFYEWQAGEGGKKQPLYFKPADGRPLAFAGLWESWKGPKEAPLDKALFTTTIITTDANAFMRPIHDRMPMILEAGDWDTWLDPEADRDTLLSLLKPAREGGLVAVPVSTRVNSVRNQGPDLVEPVGAQGSLI